MMKVIVYTVCFVVVVGLSIYGINKMYQYGWTGGYSTADAMWKTKATEALGKKINNINEFNAILTQRTLDYNKEVEDLERTYAEDLEYVELGKDMAIAAVLDGTVKLYDPFDPKRAGTGTHCPGASKTGGVTVCADVSDDSERRELSPKTAAFLFGEALRADAYTEQLTKCQRSVYILTRMCGGVRDADSTN